MRLTAQDVVFTKRTAKILREKGHIIPATRIIEHDDPFSRAVLSEDISMGQKWTHYGAMGEYGEQDQNLMFLDNPWRDEPIRFIVPYYFDPNYKIDPLNRKTITDSLEWFNSELNGCIVTG